MIILAVIVTFTVLETLNSANFANFAKLASEFSDFNLSAYMNDFTNDVLNNQICLFFTSGNLQGNFFCSHKFNVFWTTYF